jgi:hypothetical protein
MSLLRRPHHLHKSRHTARVILAVKNFAAIQGVCHIGLGVTASQTMKVLRRDGYYCEVLAAQTSRELRDGVERLQADAYATNKPTVSHVVISSPAWVAPQDYKQLALDHPDVEWVQLNHSGAAYLSIDKHGIKNIRAIAGLEQEHHNVRLAGNNVRFVRWCERAIGPCLHLPNLYDIEGFAQHAPATRPWANTLRVGCFGASRPWKNQLTAAESVIELAHALGVNVELYVNSRRPDGGERMIESREELFYGMRDAKLVYVPWEPWGTFRKTIATMHLMYQPSFDETFDVIAADGIAEGVASVVSGAIEWCPTSWQCDAPFDPNELTKVALQLLHDPHAVDDGRHALRSYVLTGLEKWRDYLGRDS